MKKLQVLVGGGHAHLDVLRDLAERPDDRWEVTLVTPYHWFTYSGMIPGHSLAITSSTIAPSTSSGSRGARMPHSCSPASRS